MKTSRLIFISGFSFVIPLVTFLIGYRVGQTNETVVYHDAPQAIVVQEKLIGTVAGTQSAELTPVSVKQDKSSAKETANISGISNLWQAVNEYRQARDLVAFVRDDVLCELVNERLGELRERGSLDDHAGFRSRTSHYLNEEKYRKLAENTAQGYSSASETIVGWIKSTGHKALLEATDVDRGCSAAVGGFAVLIAGKR